MRKYKNNLIFCENLIYTIPKGIKIIEIKDETNIYIYLDNYINEHYFKFFICFLKKHTNFLMHILGDITAIDMLKFIKKNEYKNRFKLFYNFLSIFFNFRIFIIKDHNELKFSYSLTDLFKSSGWLEREIWDFFGIIFKNNSDLRRILTDYGFEGFPLRKDFPLVGFLEINYDENKKCLNFINIEISQEFRNFKFLSPWEEI